MSEKNIKAMTMVRNDRFLAKWVAHYGRELGRENLYVFFDGEDQEVPGFCAGVNAVVLPKMQGNVVATDRARARFMSEQAARLMREGAEMVIATDADVDGMHIRLLLLTFFLQFFPDVVRSGHLYILQTPLFRVRNKKETRYCYSDAEREKAIKQLGPKPEITRFKGLGEISPDEFGGFIGKDIRLEPVRMTKQDPIGTILSYYMGKNTNDRQDFIIDNLYVEKDEI